MAPIQYVVEGGRRLCRHHPARGNKNSALPIIAAALLTEQPVHAGKRAAHPRHGNPGRADQVRRRRDRLAGSQHARDPRQGCSRGRPRSRPVRTHSRLDPARGTVARALRPGGAAATRRRRDRPPPARHAFSGVRATRRDGQGGRPAGVPREAPDRRRRLPRRAERDGDGKRPDGAPWRRTARRRYAMPRPNRMCRISPISSSRSGRASTASAPTRWSCTARSAAFGDLRVSGPITSRSAR